MAYRSDGVLTKVTSAISATKPASPIYGISWDRTENPVLVRTDDAIGMTANAGVGSATVVNDFDSTDLFGAITTVEDSYGNVFARIPKCYIEKGQTTGALSKRVSRSPFGTAYLPKCFINADGSEND